MGLYGGISTNGPYVGVSVRTHGSGAGGGTLGGAIGCCVGLCLGLFAVMFALAVLVLTYPLALIATAWGTRKSWSRWLLTGTLGLATSIGMALWVDTWSTATEYDRETTEAWAVISGLGILASLCMMSVGIIWALFSLVRCVCSNLNRTHWEGTT